MQRKKYQVSYSTPWGGGYSTEDREARITFNRLNRYMKNKRVKFVVRGSPFVGNVSYAIFANTLSDLKKGIMFAKQYGYFDYDSAQSIIEDVK